MARRRRRSKAGRVILVLIFVSVFIALCIYTAKYFIGMYSTETDTKEKVEKDTEKNTIEEKNDDGYQIDLVDYECYPNSVFDFDFAIIRVRFQSDSGVRFELKDIKTSEGITLDKTDSYIEVLSNANYFITSKNVVNEIVSNESSYMCYLFVPYTTDDTSLTLSFSDEKDIFIDLTKNYMNIEDLKYDDGTFISSDDYEIYVSNAFVAGAIFRNGEFTEIPSSQKIYTFELTISSIDSHLKLKEAKYVTKEGKEYNALDEEYTSAEAAKNMFTEELEEGNTYGLFFKVISQDSAPVSYDGELWLMFTNSDEYVKISARFE